MNETAASRIAYWITTGALVAESLGGGIADLFRLDPFFATLTRLGYPAYLATILGVAKLLAATTIAAPRLARLKEWAYAGILINMTGAAASHLAVHDRFADWIPPLMFAALALASWRLRPPSRCLSGNPATCRKQGTSPR